MTERSRARLVLPLALGLVALVVGTAFGWNSGALASLVSPAPIIRAALVGASAWLAVELLRRALLGLNAGEDVPSLVRGIRLAFLAVAAFAVGAGWLLANPLPLIVALVIAGVDVIETSFLLLVAGAGTLAGPSDQAD
jgi:polyferredoxin